MSWLARVFGLGAVAALGLRLARRRAAAVAALERANRNLGGRVRARGAALARSEARLGLALDAAGMAEWEIDLATGAVVPSPRLNRLLGYPAGRRLTVDDLRARLHPDEQAEVGRWAAATLAGGGRSAERDLRIVRPDGAVRWLHARGEVLRDAAGRPARATGVALDVTGRRRAERALRESEERYRSLVAATSQIVWTTDPEGRFVAPQPSWQGYTGQSWEEAGGRGWAGAVHPEDRGRIEAAWIEAVRGGTGYKAEGRLWCAAAGAYRPFVSRAVPVRAADGGVREWIGVNADVSDRRLAEAALRRERELLQRIMDTIPVMLVLYEPDTRTLRLNPAFERLAGWTAEEARAVDLMAACYPDPAYRERVRAFMAESEAGWMDIEMTARDGRVVQTSWANIRFPDNTRVGIGIDITGRKRAEERQRMLVAELSHRVKNTLATVQSIAQRSLTADRPVEAAREAFMERLRALGDTHGLLTAGAWQGASLRRLVEGVLAPYGRRAAVASDDLLLNPKAALTLGLVLHELATNAAKYGALAATEGRVDVHWTVEDGAAEDGGPALRLVWRERGGPPVAPPARAGFGRTLIERAVAYDLSGTTRLDFRPEGVVCELAAPLAEVAAA